VSLVAGIDWNEWAARFANRDEAAEEYAGMLELNGTAWAEWHSVNEAIIQRWSVSGLRYVKERAWQLICADGGSACL
jgi:hypothetical protein